ncbi:MAG: SPOR domain-containing protein [Paracoccaceae bacterium]
MNRGRVREGVWVIVMRNAHFLTVPMFVLSICAGLAAAQSETGPAETPPNSFNGRQFVDSRGCVFLRAGTDGNTYWVPRLNTARQPICAQKSTVFVGQAPQMVLGAQDVFVIEDNTTVPDIVTDVGIETPSVHKEEAEELARTVAPIAIPEPDVPVVFEETALSKPIATAPDALVVVPKPALKSRTEPKTASPERQTSVTGTKTKAVPKVERAIQKHVDSNRRDAGAVVVPKENKRILENIGLNAQRTEQGEHREMRLIWTATAPHRLINQLNGEDMTQKMALVFPYTDKARQRREFGKVTLERRDGKVIKRVRRRVAKTRAAATDHATNLPLDGARFVQVGAFANPENADRTEHLLQENGLNVHFLQAGRSDKPLRLVLVGPFESDQDVRDALETARIVGFRDAFVRKTP